MDCRNCQNLEKFETDDVNVPGGKIIRFECKARFLMTNMQYFPFKTDTFCEEEKPESQNLNLI